MLAERRIDEQDLARLQVVRSPAEVVGIVSSARGRMEEQVHAEQRRTAPA